MRVDKIILRGKSPSLVYIWINNDKIEIRDAAHLAGKGAMETGVDPQGTEAADGPGRGYWPCRREQGVHGVDRAGRSSASRLGIGAVMGSKGVKAIAVRGTKDINLARPGEFLELCNDAQVHKVPEQNPVPNVMTILQGLGSPQEMLHTDEKWHTENFMWGNARTRRKDFWNDQIEKKWKDTQVNVRKRLISCYNCPIKCGAIITVPGISTYMMKFSRS